MATPTHIFTEFQWTKKKSVARWSREPSGKLVVFVHGFGGSHKTWDDFHELLPRSEVGRGSDFVFYCYDGLNTRADPSASKLFDFLWQLAENPAEFINQTVIPKQHRTPFVYDQIVIVAHSLGAIVSRLALLRVKDENPKWKNKLKLLLFAPAHLGAEVVPLVRDTFLLGRILPLASFLKFQALIDLDKDSDILKQLWRETEATLAQNGEFRNLLVADAVWFGDNENVVSNARFCSDPNHQYIEGRRHSTVCKPTHNNKEPLKYILPHLK